MSDIKKLTEMLETGGFRSACDWLCLKMNHDQLMALYAEMKEIELKLTSPDQEKMFEQGLLAIQMTLETLETRESAFTEMTEVPLN